MAEKNENIIETVDEDGNVIKFELFDVVEFEEQEYALLIPEDEMGSDDPEIVLMKVVSDGEEYSFETIDDEDEFDAVSEYIESLGEDE